MRDIEFRGLRNGLWFYGSLLHRALSEGFYICHENTARTITDLEVEPETVGQYTGLKDKNGVKIFEGDILYCSDRNYSLIRHISGAYELHEVGTDKMFFLYKHLDKVSVIGNIHEEIK